MRAVGEALSNSFASIMYICIQKSPRQHWAGNGNFVVPHPEPSPGTGRFSQTPWPSESDEASSAKTHCTCAFLREALFLGKS